MFFRSAKKGAQNALKIRFIARPWAPGFSNFRLFPDFGRFFLTAEGRGETSSLAGLIPVSKLNTPGTPWRGAADF